MRLPMMAARSTSSRRMSCSSPEATTRPSTRPRTITGQTASGMTLSNTCARSGIGASCWRRSQVRASGHAARICTSTAWATPFSACCRAPAVASPESACRMPALQP